MIPFSTLYKENKIFKNLYKKSLLWESIYMWQRTLNPKIITLKSYGGIEWILIQEEIKLI